MHRLFRFLLFINPSNFFLIISNVGLSNLATQHENGRSLKSKIA